MRRIACVLMLIFVFAIPWEYSLELGEPLGNIARVVGLVALLAAIPAVFQTGRVRTPGLMLWLVLALYLWLCCTYFWTIEPQATLARLRGYFQEMMIVWLVWEFAESAGDLRALTRAYIAGSWVLAALTLANYVSADAMASQQVRFVATGQDPNDVARYLNLAFPLAALLVNSERKWPWRLMAAGFMPLGLLAVLLTASRGGFVEVVVALIGSGFLLGYGHPKRVWAGALALPPLAVLLWWIVPRGSFERLATINEQLQGGGLNLRWNIWMAGWHAFVKAPVLGTGVGSFVSAAGLAPIDTAHNSALSIAVGGGLVALFLAAAIVAVAVWSITRTKGQLRWALALTFVIWCITAMVATVEENRTTWLLLAMIALAGRLADEEPKGVDGCFSAAVRTLAMGAVVA